MVHLNSIGGRSSMLMAQNMGLFGILCIVMLGLMNRTNVFLGNSLPSSPGVADTLPSLGSVKEDTLARVARLAPNLHLQVRQARQAGTDEGADTCVEGEGCFTAGEEASVASTAAAAAPEVQTGTATTAAVIEPATTRATETSMGAGAYVLPDHPMFPVCTPDADKSPSKQLQNKLTDQCLAERSDGRLVNTDCGNSNTLWLCVDPTTGTVRTPDNQCFGMGDKDAEYEYGYLELVPCTQVVGYWRMQEDGRVVNTDTDFCVDARHNHMYADIVQYECKDDDGYKPKNQMWKWYG
eukprot:comp11702_c0_seq1/m.6263 comp11702_c0_seq1/g.6263  ORF comp11702_c0_seq1/g.6263 comp11702_c0_seq1/m.6263 type:complete len:295 (-) comp11702_c0_seq1:295-1179(-)